MASPHGFDHFCEFLRGLEDQYVIIGGGAASILMDDQELEFRKTKDVDLVVLTRSDELNARILAYIKAGGYKSKEATKGQPRYYRFQLPVSLECPPIIEIFARNELGLELEGDQHIIPITNAEADRLSAILLDDEYFDLIRQNLLISRSGIPIINSIANICLKARAHRELLERKEKGAENVDERDIQKHLKDILRIAATLTEERVVSLPPRPAADIANAIKKLDVLPEAQFRQLMAKTPGAQQSQIMSLLRRVFSV